MIDIVGRSGAIMFAVLLLIAVAHKLRSIASGRAAAEPLVAVGSRTARHATAALLAASAVECCVAAALVALPSVGYFAFAALLGGYIWRLRLLAANEDCNCFGELLAAKSRRSAMVRNAIMATGSLFAGTVVATGVVDPAAVSPTVVGLVAIPIAGGIASHLIDRLNQSHALRNI